MVGDGCDSVFFVMVGDGWLTMIDFCERCLMMAYLRMIYGLVNG